MRTLAFLLIPLALGASLHIFKVPLLATFMGSQIQNYSLRYYEHSPEDFLTKNLPSILADRNLLEKTSFFNWEVRDKATPPMFSMASFSKKEKVP